MHIYLTLLTIAVFYTVFPSTTSAQIAGPKGDLIVVGKIDTIHSVILGEDRAIWVSVPESGIFPDKKYPVVYLLDGDAHFYSVMGMIQQLSTVNGNSVCPEMILIGIPNTDRMRDLTPTYVTEAMGDTLFNETTGGLVNFTSFIENELMPFVESHFPVSPFKMYIGHSLGGLAVIHTLLTRPYLFNSWVAIDPSLWWDDRLINTMSDSLKHKSKYADESLYLAIANTMPEDMAVDKVVKDTSMNTEHIRSILEFSDVANRKMKSNGMEFRSKYYDAEDHGSLPLIAEIDALKYLFKWYAFGFKDLEKFMDPGSTADTKEFVDLVNHHYKGVSDHFGFQVLPDERMINSLGYEFLAQQKSELSFVCFEMNVKNYPQSTNVFDSMGDYYMTIGEDTKALDCFSKALAIEEVPLTREKYETLKKK